MLKLYRGDATKIDEFQLKKTDPYSLVGRGIYLTDTRSVAETYRKKGHPDDKPELFYGLAKDRQDALRQALENFVRRGLLDMGYNLPKVTKSRAELSLTKEFNEMVDTGVLKVEYIFQERQKNGERNMKVVYNVPKSLGYLTSFDFPKEEFEKSILNINNVIPDESFWRRMWDHKVAVGLECHNREQYITLNRQTDFYTYGQHDFFRPNSWTKGGKDKIARRLSRVMKPFGFQGLEYEGGRTVGGAGYHRAFCLWSEEYVNAHKVHCSK